jgi:hypothetical protein
MIHFIANYVIRSDFTIFVMTYLTPELRLNVVFREKHRNERIDELHIHSDIQFW